MYEQTPEDNELEREGDDVACTSMRLFGHARRFPSSDSLFRSGRDLYLIGKKYSRVHVSLCCLPYWIEVHRILKIRTPYSRILSSILKGLPHLGIEYFRVPESLVKLNDLVGIEYLEVPESLVVPNDLVGNEYLEVPKSLVVSNDLV